MDEWELRRREAFQREQREAREDAATERQRRHWAWQEKRELSKLENKAIGVEQNNHAAMERLFVDAELNLKALQHEYLFGEWSKGADHQRALELALVELNRMEHSANLTIKVENNRHGNSKDYKSHETDEYIRLKRELGQLSPEELKKFFAEFETEYQDAGPAKKDR